MRVPVRAGLRVAVRDVVLMTPVGHGMIVHVHVRYLDSPFVEGEQ
jgi:hypothetical protein